MIQESQARVAAPSRANNRCFAVPLKTRSIPLTTDKIDAPAKKVDSLALAVRANKHRCESGNVEQENAAGYTELPDARSFGGFYSRPRLHIQLFRSPRKLIKATQHEVKITFFFF